MSSTEALHPFTVTPPPPAGAGGEPPAPAEQPKQMFTVRCSSPDAGNILVDKTYDAEILIKNQYFRAMLESSFSEAASRIVTKPEWRASAVDAVVHFLESDSLRTLFTELPHIFVISDEINEERLLQTVVEATVENFGEFATNPVAAEEWLEILEHYYGTITQKSIFEDLCSESNKSRFSTARPVFAEVRGALLARIIPARDALKMCMESVVTMEVRGKPQSLGFTPINDYIGPFWVPTTFEPVLRTKTSLTDSSSSLIEKAAESPSRWSLPPDRVIILPTIETLATGDPQTFRFIARKNVDPAWRFDILSDIVRRVPPRPNTHRFSGLRSAISVRLVFHGFRTSFPEKELKEMVPSMQNVFFHTGNSLGYYMGGSNTWGAPTFSGSADLLAQILQSLIKIMSSQVSESKIYAIPGGSIRIASPDVRTWSALASKREIIHMDFNSNAIYIVSKNLSELADVLDALGSPATTTTAAAAAFSDSANRHPVVRQVVAADYPFVHF